MWEMKLFYFGVVTHRGKNKNKIQNGYAATFFFNLHLHVGPDSQRNVIVTIDNKLDFAFSIVELLDFAPADKLNTVRASFDKGITQLRERLAITLKTLRGIFVACDE